MCVLNINNINSEQLFNYHNNILHTVLNVKILIPRNTSSDSLLCSESYQIFHLPATSKETIQIMANNSLSSWCIRIMRKCYY